MSPRTFVYVANSRSLTISVLQLREDGELTPVAEVPVPSSPPPPESLPLAISRDQRFLYAALRTEPYSAVTFAIDPTGGGLTYVGSGPLADSLPYITVDQTGRFLLGASYGGHRVTVNPISPGGVVEPVLHSLATAPKAHCIVVDGSNRRALFTSLGGDLLYQAQFDARTGTLSLLDPPAVSVRPGAGPRHLVFSPDGRFVYLLNELDGSLYVFPFEGTLKAQVQIVSVLPEGFTGKPWAADLHLSPDGATLYASERTSSTLAAFRVETPTGQLRSLGFFATARQPREFAIAPSGRWLLALGEASDQLRLHPIDPDTGTPGEGRVLPVGAMPNWIEVLELP